MARQFLISHTIHYGYSRPVFLEPHRLRLSPRGCGYQHVHSTELQLQPEPALMSHSLDVEGNLVARAWFEGEHDELTLRATSQVITLRENPFDYLLEWSRCGLPMRYPGPQEALLASARRRVELPAGPDPVGEFAGDLAARSEQRAVPFLTSLNESLHDRFEVVHRKDGEPWLPSETWRRRQGACRDLAVLFIEACRAVGLAARFVSGYQEGDTEQESRYLHAWAEVYLPGGGWRGYDPTHGLAVADRHVAVATASSPSGAAPITGSFRGSGASSTVRAQIEIRVAETDAAARQAQQQ